MYTIEDLFDKRSVVGSRLEQIIKDKGSSKLELCSKIGMSRPTLNKLLAGTLTSKTNFEKHISKILKFLDITPDAILYNVVNSKRRIRQIRQMMRVATKDVANFTGISLKRLKEIESGEEASIAELRDIALCLDVSVRTLSGENVFETQVATLNDIVDVNKTDEISNLSGFWGHVGVLLNNTDKYLWYPITGATRSEIYKTINNDRIIIPCMNNKILFLYMPNVKEIVLLDDACDEPDFANWDSAVSEGEIPLVVYEALEDYDLEGHGGDNDERLSSKFKARLKKFIAEQKLDENKIQSMLYESTIYYADGKNRVVNIDFDGNDTVSTELLSVYDYEDIEPDDNTLSFTDFDGMEIFITIKNISMMELPLLQVENAVANIFKEVSM